MTPSSVSLLKVKRVAQKPKKKNRRKLKNKFEDQDYEESRGIVNRLKKKYAKKEKVDEIILNAIVRDGKLHHPTKYTKQFERCLQGQWSRHCAQPEIPSNVIKSLGICALCQLPACHGDMNDLFGPFFIEAGLSTPTFLWPSGAHPDMSHPQKIEVYLHNQCALWSHDLFFYGGKFPKLMEKLSEYWNQTCHFCGLKGASIKLGSIQGHYQCLRNHNYEFNPEFFTIKPPVGNDFCMFFL